MVACQGKGKGKGKGRSTSSHQGSVCSLALHSAVCILSLSIDPPSSSGSKDKEKDTDKEDHVNAVVGSLYALFRAHPTSVPVLAALHTALSCLAPRTTAISGDPVPSHAQVKLVGSGLSVRDQGQGQEQQSITAQFGPLDPIQSLHQVDSGSGSGSGSVEELLAQVLTTSS